MAFINSKDKNFELSYIEIIAELNYFFKKSKLLTHFQITKKFWKWRINRYIHDNVLHSKDAINSN